MRRKDFMAMRPAEFEVVVRMHRDAAESQSRDNWERTRMLAYITLLPNMKKRLTPQQIMPLPWDKSDKEPAETPEQRKEDFLKALEKSKRYNSMKNGK